jgi:SsrA-binding protein
LPIAPHSSFFIFHSSLKLSTPANVNIKNRRASFEYYLLETFTAGIQLTGTEIKSIRESKASIADAFCLFRNNELWVINMHIAEYTYGTYSNHDPKRDRKLLLNRKELKKLLTKTKEKGLTLIPTLLFISDRGFAKLNIALARGKHSYDKRESIKSRDIKRDTDKHLADR